MLTQATYTFANSETPVEHMDSNVIHIDGHVIQESSLRYAPFGRMYVTTPDGWEWTKRGKDGEWTVFEAARNIPSRGDGPLQLVLAMVWQAEGEPDHWCLLIGKEGLNGQIYQVQGDPTTSMYYAPESDSPLLASPSLKSAFVLNSSISLEQQDRVRYWSENTEPPSAERGAVLRGENCQQWCTWVLQRLHQQEKGIVDRAKVIEVNGYLPGSRPP